MLENSSRKLPAIATDAGPRPGDFPLCSASSRAAARAIIAERNRTKGPPTATLDFSSESIERCQQIYEDFLRLRPKDPNGPGVIIIGLRFPSGFTPHDPQTTMENGQNIISPPDDFVNEAIDYRCEFPR